MEVDSRKQGDIVIIKLDGKFNIEFIDRFDSVFRAHIIESPSLIAVSLQDIEYVDSSALGSLIKAMNFSKKSNIKFCIYDLSPNILTVFQLSYLDKYFEITTADELSKQYPEGNF